MTVLSKSHEVKEPEGWGDGGKLGRELSEINTKALSGGYNELIGEFKMVTSDVLSMDE